jgi:GT2 family glycosyltransferase
MSLPDPRVSVIVPTRNGASRLPDLLAALARQTLPAKDFEVVVVSDGSTDDTEAVVRAGGLARLVPSKSAMGVPRATNFGVSKANGKVLVFTDDDVTPSDNWLEAGLDRMDGTSAADVVAGHIEVPLGPRPTGAELLDVGRGYLDQAMYAEKGFGATANLWVHRPLYERLGGFDERFTAQTHDYDFGRRVVAAGGRVVYGPEVRVTHPPRHTAKQLARKEYRLALGDVELRCFGTPGAPTVLIWRLAHYYRPWAGVRGVETIRSRGYRVGRRETLRLIALQYACTQVPAVVGSIRGSLHRR